MKWIDVKDKAPGLGERILICGPKGGINIGRRHYEDVNDLVTIEASGSDRKITHWMPLPTPPKK